MEGSPKPPESQVKVAEAFHYWFGKLKIKGVRERRDRDAKPMRTSSVVMDLSRLEILPLGNHRVVHLGEFLHGG